jgi:hypothetical protein
MPSPSSGEPVSLPEGWLAVKLRWKDGSWERTPLYYYGPAYLLNQQISQRRTVCFSTEPGIDANCFIGTDQISAVIAHPVAS